FCDILRLSNNSRGGPMSFCTGCGNNVDPASKFCDKCGKPMGSIPAQPAASTAAAPSRAPITSPTAPPTKQGGGALKVILVILGIFVLLFVIAVAGIVGFGYYVAKQARVHQTSDGGTKIETPFGNIEADDPAKTA